MGLVRIEGLNVAQIIELNGTDPQTRDRSFIRSRDRHGHLQSITYADYLQISQRYARMIQGLRAQRKKSPSARFHVAFFMQNTPEALYLLGGCALTNATLVGINNAQTGARLAADVRNADVDVIFVDDAPQPRTERSFLASLVRADQRFGLPGLFPDFVIARRRLPEGHPPMIRTLDEALAHFGPGELTPSPLDENAPGMIIFTSGTTGAPKGIEIRWKKLVDVGVLCTTLMGYDASDVGYVCMPLNHSNSLYLNLMPALLNGATIFLRRRFSARSFVRDIEDAGVTLWNSVGDPVAYVLNTVGPEADYRHLSLRMVISTGTNAANRVAFARIFGLQMFAEAYGATEVGVVTLVTPETPDYSVGMVVSGKDVRICNELTDEMCEPAQVDGAGRIINFDEAVGEVVVRQASLGASAFSGYYNLPEQSAEAVDGRGFYHMGDLGAMVEINDHRHLIFMGRTGTARLRSRGENFSAACIERLLLDHPGVVGCAVIGVPHTDSTENDNPLFVLEVQRPERFDVGLFLRYCYEELPDYTRPGFIRLRTGLPRTDTHKIKKSALLHQFFERTPELDADPDDQLYRVHADGSITPFETADSQAEMARCTDPAVQTRFMAVTRRKDLF